MKYTVKLEVQEAIDYDPKRPLWIKDTKKWCQDHWMRLPYSNSYQYEFYEWQRSSPYTEKPHRVLLSREVVNGEYVKKKGKYQGIIIPQGR